MKNWIISDWLLKQQLISDSVTIAKTNRKLDKKYCFFTHENRKPSIRHDCICWKKVIEHFLDSLKKGIIFNLTQLQFTSILKNLRYGTSWKFNKNLRIPYRKIIDQSSSFLNDVVRYLDVFFFLAIKLKLRNFSIKVDMRRYQTE